jgi:pSer/pThr/pTyr-binding forkhead associated (FHA) protein/ribosomal protein L40E
MGREIFMSDSREFKICEKCFHENLLNAEMCNKCGARLNGMFTLDDANLNPEPAFPKPPVSIKPEEGFFTFYIPGFDQPFKLPFREEAIIGRHQQGSPMPDVDLTPYHGYLAGISRHHAQLKIVDKEVMVTDLGSSNGTWVNEFKLPPHSIHPLRSGDMLRLGNLLLFIYFQPVEFTEQTLLVRDTRGAINSGLTTNVFSAGLLSLLTAIQELQVCIKKIQDQPAHEVQIKSVNFDKDRALIQVKVMSAKEAIEFSQGNLIRRRHELTRSFQEIASTPVGDTLPAAASVDLAVVEN